jgi:hypothetical protein
MQNILVRKPEVKRLFQRPNSGWENNIKCMLKRLDVRAWIGLNRPKIGSSGRLS